MKSETLANAVKKATFTAGIREVTIDSDGTTGVISTICASNTAMVLSRFPMEVEGSWAISDPDRLIKCLNNIKTDVNIGTKDGSMTLKGGSKSYKIPLVQSTRKSPYTPTRRGLEIYLREDDETPAVVNPALFSPEDIKAFKAAVKSESVYDGNCILRCSSDGILTIAGQDDTDFKAADHLPVKFHMKLCEAVTSKYDEIPALAKVLGNENVIISLGQNKVTGNDLLYVEDIEGEVKTIFLMSAKR
jgi:hypothetical protein